uniref:Uncharacterized protein n=1 Tax=Tetraselmis sp. GSL018 TaxID=582737 RepID=A0A061SC54_9CHLO|mmetsp:Transcript_40923/g.97252  ORF Transcript_40923/g.97252 Transcript_40923/m.97252 type:complete len:169 (-) Transcript_40923:155-661(-)
MTDRTLNTVLNVQASPEKILIPSALRTNDRCSLKESHPVEYSHLYHFAHKEKNVWSRLVKDGRRRDDARTAHGSYAGACTLDRAPDSGYAMNNAKSKTVEPAASAGDDPDVKSLHSKTLRSFRKKYPIEFMTAVRPKAQTMNQTLGIWGYQDTDKEMAGTLQRSQRIY